MYTKEFLQNYIITVLLLGHTCTTCSYCLRHDSMEKHHKKPSQKYTEFNEKRLVYKED